MGGRADVVTAVLLPLAMAATGCKFEEPPDVADIDAPPGAVDAEPDAMLDPAELFTSQEAHDFGAVTTGQSSALLSVLVRNVGDLETGTINVSLGGDAPGEFTIVPTGDAEDCAGAVLAAEEACTAQVRYTPTVAGASAATLRVSADPGGALDVPVSGTGLTPGDVVIVAGASLDFGTVEIQSQSANQTISVRNDGGSTTAALSVMLSDVANYTLAADACDGVALAPGGTCSIQVRFNPTSVGVDIGASVAIRESQTSGVSASAMGNGSARLSVTKSGTGTITSTPSGINCGPTCTDPATASFTQTPVVLTATAPSGWAFDGWSGACASAGMSTMCSVALTQPLTSASASFRQLECTPNTTACDGSTLEVCDSTGMVASSEACSLGCMSSPSPHCAHIEPVYLPTVCDASAAAPTLSITGNQSESTNNDTFCNGGVVTQTGGPPICVVRYGTISIAQGGGLTITGARALALVADGNLTVSGLLDVSANGTTSGPGGGSASSGGAPGSWLGGGGAGFKQGGAAGGSETANGGGAGGGSTFDPLTGAILVGGRRATSSSGFLNVVGGGGGGAATLISCKGTVAVTASGLIDAGGGGGAGGRDLIGGQQIDFLGGGGGGSGGYVVFQGGAISLTGSFYSNGGGGGAGPINDSVGDAGDDGPRSTSAAAGGTAVSPAGSGGAGGRGAANPGVGLRSTTTSGAPGGGGGSTGRFQVYSPLGASTVVSPASTSPTFETGRTVPTK